MFARRLFIATPVSVAAAAVAGGFVITFMGLYSQDMAPGSAATQVARLFIALVFSVLISPISIFLGAIPASLGLVVAGPLHLLLTRQGMTNPFWYLLAGAASGLAVGLMIPVFNVACVIGGAIGGLTFHRLAGIVGA